MELQKSWTQLSDSTTYTDEPASDKEGAVRKEYRQCGR